MGKRRFQHDEFFQHSPVEQDVVALIKRMQQQLAFLEKKLDILINQSQDKPSGERHFSKPFRASGHPHRHAGGRRDTGYGEKRFDRGRRFEKRQGENNLSFGQTGKSYDGPRESEGAPEHLFEKRPGGEKRGLTHKKKSYYNRRKDRGARD
jgi:hypothetical protein